MKTTIIRPKTRRKAVSREFPLLATSIRLGFTVLFTSENSGMVIKTRGQLGHRLGSSCECWFSCFDEDKWRIEPKGTKLEIVVD